MTINLSDNNPRVSYAVAQGVTQTSFTVSFEFFDNDDLNVYVDGTLKTITTHYTVSGGSGSTGTITMSVTGATGGSTVVITRDIDLDRTTDFPSSGPFNIGSLNTELDRIIAIQADLDDLAARSLHLADYDTAVSVELPVVDTRKGTVLGFNATTGAVEAGPKIADVSTLAAVTADIATLADIEDGTDATDAIQTVAGISSNVTTVAGVSGNVTTVAGISSNVTTVAGISANTTTVAGISSDVTTVAGISSNVSTVAGISSNVTTVAGDSADIQALAAKTTELGLLGTADAIADMNTLATSAIVTDLDALANLTTEIDALGDVTSDITTVSGISANVTTVAGVAANVTTVAGISTNVTTVAGISSNVTTVAGISANVTTVAGDTANIGTIATNLGGTDTIGTVAGSISNVNTVGGAITNVNTVATNISGVNSFAERYRVGSSDPTTSLDAGDLAFNTSDNGFKFYDGSAWQTVNVSGIGSVADDTTPQLGGNLDVNGNEITSASSGNVVLNPNGSGQIQLNSTVVVQDGTHDFDVASHDGTNGLKLGGTLVTSTAAELNILDGVTSTATELNILDGVTATTSELNILDGVTSTTAELNILDGVTSTTAELNILDGVTATATELNLLDGVTATTTELNLLDGVTATTTELNYVDVTTLGTSQASKAVTADANGVVTFDNGTIEESTTITSSSNAATINLRDGNVFEHDLTENVTYTFSNPASSGRASAFILKVIQDSTARTITWPASVDWAAATAPTLTATNNGVDVFGFLTIDGGTTYYGFTLGQALG